LKGRLEKKRKRKRDESPMGPPEKVPPKQDPLTKPVTVSIKPAESPPLNMTTPTSPSMMRKFNASPTQNRNISMSGKLSPNLMKPTLKTGSSHHSPKHSPAHVPSSPKHILPGISSPKSHGTSPKHPSTSGSGKPSMSTLKSAANSPSSKSGDSKTKSTSKDSSRDKDKKLSGVFNVGASKNKSSVKVKPLDLNSDSLSGVQDGLPSPSSTDLSKSSNSNQVRNRKGSLSAIVDKLKSSAQHCDGVTDLSSKSTGGSGGGGGNRERSGQVSAKLNESKSGKMGENKNSEYMVKPSSDGMKITINKTRSKDSKASLSKSGTGSPKTHTGLKPGVNSGPASKKPQHVGQKISGSNLSNSTGGSANYGSMKSGKIPSSGAKVSSGGPSKSLSKLTGSPKSATDLSRKDRPKLNKSGSDKSIFSTKDGRKSSPTSNRDESDGVYKMSKMDHYNPPSIVEGLMTVRQLDKNFQIPKLSARAAVDDKKPKVSTDNLNNINRTVDTKIFDMINKTDLSLSKYPLAMPGGKAFDNSMDAKLRNNVTNALPLPSPSPKVKEAEEEKKDQPQNLTQNKDDAAYKINYPIAVSKSVLPPISEPLNLFTKSIDLTSKFVAPAPKDDKKDAKTAKNDGDVLLDFSGGNKMEGKSGGQMTFPQSPSVSVHIVKSPAPSPLIAPSPHSASPCITDDELMDEAVIGIGK
jgi:mediator of RNA polymerase II transcription subunit 1